MNATLQSLPFSEAIQYLKTKNPVPTRFWNDLAGQAHAKSFAIAGATKSALLKDIQGELTKALKEGTTLSQFKEQFDKITKKHGWEYRGSSAWRSRVIYNTNLLTARAAGRWQQIQRSKHLLPFLQYMTANDERVRVSHQNWHGIILSVDDAWWHVYYPPNGWGCRCMVRALSQKAIDRAGLKVSDSPEIIRTGKFNTKTGEFYGDIPTGIDPGWDHNPGITLKGPDIALGDHIANAPEWISKAILSDTRALKQQIEQPYTTWLTHTLTSKERPTSTAVVGFIDHKAITNNPSISNATITINATSATTAPAILANLPKSIANPIAILTENRTGKLIYIISTTDQADRHTAAIINPSKTRAYPSQIESIEKLSTKELTNNKKYTIIQGDLN